MKLPRREECVAFFSTYKVPNKIKEHCEKVEELARFLARELKKSGVDVNVELVERTALLHDLFKVVSIKDGGTSESGTGPSFTPEEIAMQEKLQTQFPNMYESEVAYEIFKDDFPELALCIRNSSNPFKEEKSWEEVVVHYADWRILRNKVVRLSERLAYLRKTYPRQDDAWETYEGVIKGNEKRIFDKLDFNPEELSKMLGGVKHE